MNVQNKKGYDAVIRARTALIIGQPFFGCLALHLDLVECNKSKVITTMAVDGIHMYYNPDFVLSLSDEELVGVCAHEVMHVALMHMVRRGHRNPVIFNIAGDYVINGDLLKAGFKLPAKRLHDAKYDNMSTEEVYERIREEVQKQIDSGKIKMAGAGDGDEDGEGGGGMSLPDTDLDVGGCGGVMDAGGRQGDKHQADQVSREWDANVRMAVNTAKRANAGQIPGYLERLVHTLDAPKVSWRDVVRQFIDQSMSKDYSWSRPNRRYAGMGLTLPGFIPDALHHLVMAIDVSGSVDEAMMKTFVSEVAGALNDGVADRLTVVYADTNVRQVDEFTPGDLVTAKTVGGGGTCFNDTFKWIKEHEPDTACIVYLTDMMTSSFGEDLGIPTLWAAFLPASQLAGINPPFGQKIAVDTSE